MTNQDFPSFEVYNNTLRLIEAVRENNLQQFEELLPVSNIDLMDHAVIHMAAQFNRQEMLTTLLPLAHNIENPQGLLWAIEQNNVAVVSMLAPHLEQSALGSGLKLAHNNDAIDAIAPHIYEVKEYLAEDLCAKDNSYIFEVLQEKMSDRFIEKAVLMSLKNNNLTALKTLMDLSGELFVQKYNQNNRENLVAQAVGASVEGMNVILPYCDKNMYYKALRRSVSFDKNEHTKILVENHTYSNEEILDLFNVCAVRNDTQFAYYILKHYPIVHPIKSKILGCAVRNNDQILFDTLFQDADFNNSDDVNACHQAAWWASKRGYRQYLSTLSEKIDLNVSLETMYNETAYKFKEEHFDTLRDFLAQQQKQKIVAQIDDVGSVGRRKM